MHVCHRDSRRRRRGATLAEAALTVTTFLTLTLGMIDFGVAVFRQQVVSRAARQGARLAVVHGLAAPSAFNGGTWGTGTITAYASASGTPIIDGLVNSGALSALDLSRTQITVEWIDGSNDPENERNRVRVTVTAPYTPMLGFIFGSPTYTLSGVSVMTIAH